mgnify:CR=1 FL=1
MTYSPPAPLALSVNLSPPRSIYQLPSDSLLKFLLGGRVRPPIPPSVIAKGESDWGISEKLGVSGLVVTALSTECDLQLESGWATAAANDNGDSAVWGVADVIDHGIAIEQTPATPIDDRSSVVAWAMHKVADAISKLCRWYPANQLDDASSLHSWMMTIPADHSKAERLLNVDLSTRPWELRWDGVPRPYKLPPPGELVFDLSGSYSVPNPLQLAISLAESQPVRSIQPRDAAGQQQTGINDFIDQPDIARWGHGNWYDRSNHLPWGDDSGGIIGDLDPPIEPIQPPYLIMNTIEFYAVVGTEQIAVEPVGLSLKLDLDSYAWELSGELKGATAKNYILPDVNGPKALMMTINGWPWIFAVKSYKRNSKLVGESYSFTAVSRSQFLTGDWSDKVSYSVDAEVNAWQLAETLLTPLGFTLDRTNVTEWYRTPDWTLQAGSVSWANVTPMDIISQLAIAAGGTVQPHRTADTIIIAPRYRLSPWEWAAAQDSAFSHLIPEAMIVDGSETGDITRTTELERVLVSGTTHGAVTEVIRRNTAGAVSATDVSDVLNQDNTANAERGRNILCDSGVIEQLSIQLPLMPPGQAPGLLEPGQLVKILRENGTDTIGMVLSNSIKPDSVSSVWQSAVLEVHHGIN